eukprot:CAMPEP_0170455938 /NCGR_PEP_ID=MMETSP0123-20130129/3737_1 /TAXON_ID=182087 /ORGANISM="Favella ehrenbergii, Strain Fehren 1" /LENGTH=134 /DNA_ID=CAMNT_0010719245 /DNA_START=2448 /DNA_END=2852 /DNA_ORIENTATION=-
MEALAQKSFNRIRLAVPQHQKVLLVLTLLVGDSAESGSERAHFLEFLDPGWQHDHERQEENDEEDLAVGCLGRNIAITSRCDAHHGVVDQIVEDKQLDTVVVITATFRRDDHWIQIKTVLQDEHTTSEDEDDGD